MKKIYNEVIDEELWSHTFSNGLELYYMPKHGFLNKYAILGVDFGSNDLEFIPINETERFRAHEGVAHFLEHKMFEQPDGGNAFDKFAELGVNANAFTSFNMTAYLFSGTDNFYPALRHFIEYIQTPYYTEENVEKEKGIIAQEIKMYQDDPDWNVYMNCLRAMYKNHHANIDIAGTVESIDRITPEELYRCYNTFYNPSNMKLFIAGDLDFDELFSIIEDANNDELVSCNDIKRFMPEEPEEVGIKKIVEEFTISMPMFYFGYKDSRKFRDPMEALRVEITTDILFDIIFSESGKLYNDLYNEGLISGSISGGYLCQKGYSYALVTGVSKDPERVKEIVDDYIDSIRYEGVDEVEFSVNKKKKIGGFLKSFDSINYIANNFLSYMFKGINFLDYLKVLRDIRIEEVNERLKEFFHREYSVISIVKPKESDWEERY